MDLKGLYSEEELISLMSEEKITILQYYQHHEDYCEEFKKYCEENHLAQDEDAAIAFNHHLVEEEEWLMNNDK